MYLTIGVSRRSSIQRPIFGAVPNILIWNYNYEIPDDIAVWVKYINLLYPADADQFYSGLLADWLTENRTQLLKTAVPTAGEGEFVLDRFIDHLRQRFAAHFG